jgi:hypothetical protein
MIVCPESAKWNITLKYFVGNTALEANHMFSKAGLAGGAWPKFVIAGISW